MRSSLKSCKSRGFSLIEILIVTALVSGLILFSFQLFHEENRHTRYIDNENEKILMRNLILSRYDCNATKAAITSECDTLNPQEAFIEVKSKGSLGKSLVLKPNLDIGGNTIHSNINGYLLRATCAECVGEPCVKRVKIEYAKETRERQELVWSDLFSGFGPGCPI